MGNSVLPLPKKPYVALKTSTNELKIWKNDDEGTQHSVDKQQVFKNRMTGRGWEFNTPWMNNKFSK